MKVSWESPSVYDDSVVEASDSKFITSYFGLSKVPVRVQIIVNET